MNVENPGSYSPQASFCTKMPLPTHVLRIYAGVLVFTTILMCFETCAYADMVVLNPRDLLITGIVGIAVIALVLFLIAQVIFVILRRVRRKSQESQSVDPEGS
jgi:hypothetical protein